MSEKILTTNVIKEQGNLYFVRANADGFLEIYAAKAGRPKKA